MTLSVRNRLGFRHSIVLALVGLLAPSLALATDFSDTYHWQIPEPGQKPYYASFVSLINAIDHTVKANQDATITSSRTISTTLPLEGGGMLSSDLTLTCAACAAITAANSWTALQTFSAGFNVSIPGYFVLTLENTLNTQNEIFRFKNTAGVVDIGRNITTASGAFEVYNGSSLFIVLDSGKAGFNTTASNLASGFHVGGSAAIGSGYAGISAPTNGLLVQGFVGFGTNSPNEGLEMGAGLNIRIPNIKSTSGTRYVCVDTTGTLVSQASACSGT